MITPIRVPMQVTTDTVQVPVSVGTGDVQVGMGLGAEYHPVHIDASFPPGGFEGDLLAKKSNADYDVEWITPANEPEQDNTRPITAAAVYTTVGNINALLATI